MVQIAALSVGALVATGAVASQAHASGLSSDTKISRPFTGKRPYQLDLHVGTTPWAVGGLIGARFAFPIVQNGFVSSINNSVNIVVGADIGTFRWYNDGDFGVFMALPVLLNWEFFFHPNWSAFGEAGVGIALASGYKSNFAPVNAGWAVGGVGGRYHINEKIALVLRVGSPNTTFGMTISF